MRVGPRRPLEREASEKKEQVWSADAPVIRVRVGARQASMSKCKDACRCHWPLATQSRPLAANASSVVNGQVQHVRPSAFAGWPVYASIVYGRAARSTSITPGAPGELGPLIPRAGHWQPCTSTLAVGSWQQRTVRCAEKNPADRPSTHPTHQPTPHPLQPSGQPTSKPASRPTNRPTNEAASQPANQSTSQPIRDACLLIL